MRLLDLSNKRFGRLFVVARTSSPDQRPRWRCWCDCGQETVVRGDYLRNGTTQSCGCLHSEISAEMYAALNVSHGGTGSPEFSSWQHMLQRCLNPNNHAWQHYGGRGIKVCAAWLAFENFKRDMGTRPPGTSLDRVDVNGGYEPGNCRWADAETQTKNRRKASA